MRRFGLNVLRLAMICVALVTAAACGNSPTSPSNDPLVQSDLKVGTGLEAVAGRTVTVHYTGWMRDTSKADEKGAQFDSSVGTLPFSFLLGAGQVIKGWDQGVPGMKIGGIRRLVVPPNLGYGSTATGSIPANSTLIFDVELLGVI